MMLKTINKKAFHLIAARIPIMHVVCGNYGFKAELHMCHYPILVIIMT